MIKNIVFDMGGVLSEYQPEMVCRHFIPDEAERKAVRTSVFVSPEWILLDMGVITEEYALARMQARLETEHERQMAALCLEHWHEYCMWPKEGMAELMRWIKSQGYGIYLCSNAALRLLSCYQDVLPEPQLFDGIFFSAEEKCMKPQKEMYGHLFERFGLKPEECFFIDDLSHNIEGARAVGMDGYCFADGDVEKLKKRLETLNQAD